MIFFFQEKESLGSLNLLDGSHSYVAAHTIHYKNKIKGDMARAETEAMCAFLNQFMPIDYNKVSATRLYLKLYLKPEFPIFS